MVKEECRERNSKKRKEENVEKGEKWWKRKVEKWWKRKAEKWSERAFGLTNCTFKLGWLIFFTRSNAAKDKSMLYTLCIYSQNYFKNYNKWKNCEGSSISYKEWEWDLCYQNNVGESDEWKVSHCRRNEWMEHVTL